MTQYKIYKLLHPITLETRYIGVTTRSLNQRLSQHISEAKNTKTMKTYKVNWIRNILLYNLKPIIELIEICGQENWEEREKYWVLNTPNLVNTHEGGKGIILGERGKTSLNNSKPILQLDIKGNLINEFISATEASKNTNISRTNIANVLSKRAITAGGFHWVFKKDFTSSYKIPIKSKIGLFGSNFIKKSIEFIDENKVLNFESIKECAIFFNVSQSFISLVLSKKRKLKRGNLRYSLI